MRLLSANEMSPKLRQSANPNNRNDGPAIIAFFTGMQ